MRHNYALKIIAIMILYFALGRLGLRFSFSESNATAIWPPVGLAIAAVVVSIINYPQLIKEELPKDSQLVEYLDRIRAAGNKASEIVKELLTLSRKSNRESKTFDLNHLIKDFVNDSVLKTLQENNTQVNFSFIPFVGELNIIGSSIHITKILMNLVINAYEACNAGGMISIRTYLTKDKLACFEVHDNGEGMSAEVQSHIFEPFYSNKSHGNSGS